VKGGPPMVERVGFDCVFLWYEEMELFVMMRLRNSMTLLAMVGVVSAGLLGGCKSTEKEVGTGTTMEDYGQGLWGRARRRLRR